MNSFKNKNSKRIILIIILLLLQFQHFPLLAKGASSVPSAPYVRGGPPINNPRPPVTDDANNGIGDKNATSQKNKVAERYDANIADEQVSDLYKKPITQVFPNEIAVKNGLVSVHVVDYLVVDLLNTVFNKLGREIAVSSNVRESISLQADDILPEDLLEFIAATAGVNWAEQDGVIIVSTNSRLAYATFFPVKYADLINMKDALSVFGIGDKIVANNYPRGLLVSGTPDTLKRIGIVIDQFDKRLPSIKVEFKVLEVNKSKERRVGISWQDGEGTYSYNKQIGDIKIMSQSGISKIFTAGIVATAQETQGWGKILARPYLITTNATEAHLSTGDEIPIFSKDYNGNPTVEYKKVGIELYATPTLLEGDLLNIKAKTIVNIISGQETQQGLTVPKISSREAETIMQIKSGETIVIGGLIKQEEIKSVVRVPVFGKIPIVGSLFKSSHKSKAESEILIFITPTLIYPNSDMENATDENTSMVASTK
ncbi:MAG: hypothetical protein LBP78_01595 [Acidaminococcales bacterium]|nr:hypothetical protein [Acidaminococcales bacterium]